MAALDPPPASREQVPLLELRDRLNLLSNKGFDGGLTHDEVDIAEADEMRGRKGYGSNTFFRVKDGWLFGTDLWHYGGELGFVTDRGERQALGEETQFIIETQFGITVLAGRFEHGVLAVLERDRDGDWSYRQLLDLPSDAFGYAFAPDGTLLVRDDDGAVAITKDQRIVPLECG
jgi:hypothetical protein